MIKKEYLDEKKKMVPEERSRIVAELLDKGVLVSPETPDEELKKLAEEEGIKVLEGEISEEIRLAMKKLNSKVEIIRPYAPKRKKLEYQDFVHHLNNRFKQLSTILRSREELSGTTSINRVLSKESEGYSRVSIIGMVSEKEETKNNHIIITLEDPTGSVKVLFSSKETELHQKAKDIVLDEVIGITGSLKNDKGEKGGKGEKGKSGGRAIIFADNLLTPDIPLGKELKKSPREEYLVIIGDLHVGSKEFLKEEFNKFLEWINGRLGSEEQRAIAKKVNYIVFTGDLVEGVGVYPGQEDDLEIKNIKGQYEYFVELLKKIPEEINIIIIPGNHDAGRIAEPQLPPYKDFAPGLYELPNVTLTTSPGWVRIGADEEFEGFDLLLYHGYSFIYYSDNVPSIRAAGGQKASEKIMKFLLQRRHLAPTHTSNLYVPDKNRDPLVIEQVPDFFITGHIHRVSFANYRGVTMINGSCWTDITDDQEKRGLEPQPGRLPIINLQTREVTIINFYKGRKKKDQG